MFSEINQILRGPPPPPPPQNGDPFNNGPINRPSFPCWYCQYVFSDARVRAEHILDVHGPPCPVCGVPLSPEEMETHRHPERSMTSAPSYVQDQTYVSPNGEQGLADLNEADREAVLTMVQLSQQPLPLTAQQLAEVAAEAAAKRKEKRKPWDENQKKKLDEKREKKRQDARDAGLPEPRTRRPKAVNEAQRKARILENARNWRAKQAAEKKAQKVAEGEEPDDLPTPTVPCPICPAFFRNDEHLAVHMETAHPN